MPEQEPSNNLPQPPIFQRGMSRRAFVLGGLSTALLTAMGCQSQTADSEATRLLRKEQANITRAALKAGYTPEEIEQARKTGVFHRKAPSPSQASSPIPKAENVSQKVEISHPNPNLKALFTEGLSQKDRITDQAKRIMPLHPTSKEREDLERELFADLEKKVQNNQASAADVLLAHQACATIDGRAWGMELFWQLREGRKLEKFDIKPLNPALREWALGRDIDPRTLAIALDTFYPSLVLLNTVSARNTLFEANNDKRVHPQLPRFLPNPGLIAGLMMTETGYNGGRSSEGINKIWGHTYIGSETALSQINSKPDYFPTAEEDLRWIAKLLQSQTGLPYLNNYSKLPGSAWPELQYMINQIEQSSGITPNPLDENVRGMLIGSGGAIGPQFMPIMARVFKEIYDKANTQAGLKYPDANPFDVFSGTIMCYMFLAGEMYPRSGNLAKRDESGQITEHPPYKAKPGEAQFIRPGYSIDNTDEQNIKVLEKWNPHRPQAERAYADGLSYFERFNRPYN